ncbi:MAG: helix-turn-helix domain-containing protein [Bacteroidia bacterium]
MEVQPQFGQLIRDLRKKRSLSQEKLAELSDLHVNHISFIERGQRTPSLQVFIQLSKGLGQKPSELMQLVETKIK